MKIAIVGAGFYGCYLGRALKRKYKGRVDLHIYDREQRAMSRAATNNQSRLHLGFHYPRSPETIRQTMQGYREFSDEFSSCIHFPRQNLYAIHRRGLVDFKEYLANMNEFGLEYEVCGDEVSGYFRDFSQVEGVIRVREGVIDLRKLDAMILSALRADVRCNQVVTHIDSQSGCLRANNVGHGPYDYVINATYVDPNLGLSSGKCFEVKYEIAAMVSMKAPFGQEVGLTIMDGDFVSLYPCGGDAATLSSVAFTPFAKFENVTDLEIQFNQVIDLARQNKVEDKILTHGESLLKINRSNLDIRGLWLSPKAKLKNDTDATRVSTVRNEGRLISVLCGKLDAVHSIADKVLSLIG